MEWGRKRKRDKTARTSLIVKRRNAVYKEALTAQHSQLKRQQKGECKGEKVDLEQRGNRNSGRVSEIEAAGICWWHRSAVIAVGETKERSMTEILKSIPIRAVASKANAVSWTESEVR
ncbi:UNVERIFIED_CONTAM: hypothetical protein Sindi_2526200 [Sesamum indicum]